MPISRWSLSTPPVRRSPAWRWARIVSCKPVQKWWPLARHWVYCKTPSPRHRQRASPLGRCRVRADGRRDQSRQQRRTARRQIWACRGINTLKVTGAESLGFSIAIDHGRRLINGTTYVADRAAPDATRSEDAFGAFSGPRSSESEQRHQMGLTQYDATVAVLSNQADYAISRGANMRHGCGAGVSAAPSGGRAWFAIWSAAAAGGGTVRADCSNMYRDILERANKVKAVMLDAS